MLSQADSTASCGVVKYSEHRFDEPVFYRLR
jgi:hypothetical protein